jgi:Flp pilus assembly protein CpaB
MVIFILSFSGIASSVLMARNLPFFSGPESTAHAGLSGGSARPGTTQVVLLATAEIPAGARLTPGMFRIDSRQVSEVEPLFVQDPEELADSFARLVIAQNTPLLRSAMTKTPASSDITARIPVGFRAVAIPVNVLTGVEGWVRPGATVDVVWSTQQGQQLLVSTIVENAKVLSVERTLESDQSAKQEPAAVPNHITLLVSPADAQKIQLAKASGSLNLSLRGAQDSGALGSSVLTSEALLVGRKPLSGTKGRVTMDGEEYALYENRLVPVKELLTGAPIGN